MGGEVFFFFFILQFIMFEEEKEICNTRSTKIGKILFIISKFQKKRKGKM